MCEGIGWPQPKYSGLNIWLKKVNNKFQKVWNKEHREDNRVRKLHITAWFEDYLKNDDRSWNYYVYNLVKCTVRC